MVMLFELHNINTNSNNSNNNSNNNNNHSNSSSNNTSDNNSNNRVIIIVIITVMITVVIIIIMKVWHAAESWLQTAALRFCVPFPPVNIQCCAYSVSDGCVRFVGGATHLILLVAAILSGVALHCEVYSRCKARCSTRLLLTIE